MMRTGAAVLALAALAACSNDVPTATGTDLFPSGTEMTTIDLLLPSDQFLSEDTVYDGYTDVRNASYLLVANLFDGALNAHGLVRFAGFPDSVEYNNGTIFVTDSVFTYGKGRITAQIDTLASVPQSMVLRLYALEQPWDSSAATWQKASPQVAWRTPGGTLGDLIAEATWERGDTAQLDTVVWQVDSLAMKKLAAPGFAGLAVTAAQTGTRVQLSSLDVTAQVHPSSKPDTSLAVTPTTYTQTFIYDPPPPTSAAALRAGGISGARSILNLKLDHLVPTCADPAAGCPMVPLKDVTLNRAILILDPLSVPSGFRPTVTHFVQLRRVLEPELGRQGSLGEVLAQDSLQASLFEPPIGKSAEVDITLIVGAYADSASIRLAMLSTSQTASFGTLWFSRSPRLRLVYTLPRTPKLP